MNKARQGRHSTCRGRARAWTCNSSCAHLIFKRSTQRKHITQPNPNIDPQRLEKPSRAGAAQLSRSHASLNSQSFMRCASPITQHFTTAHAAKTPPPKSHSRAGAAGSRTYQCRAQAWTHGSSCAAPQRPHSTSEEHIQRNQTAKLVP